MTYENIEDHAIEGKWNIIKVVLKTLMSSFYQNMIVMNVLLYPEVCWQ